MPSNSTAVQNDFWPLLQEHLHRWQAEPEAMSIDQVMSRSWGWLSSFGSEFWSAIAGAVVGGVIAYMLHRSALREARRERESAAADARKALAHSLLFKAIKIFEGLHGLKKHVDEAVNEAGSTVSLASVMFPIANLPDKIVFSSDEMAMLLSLGDDDVFNRVVSLDAIHNSVLPAWERYAMLREKFQQLSSTEHFDKETGAAAVIIEPGSPLEITLFEADQVAVELTSRAQRDTAEAKDAMTALHLLLSQKLGLKVGLSLANTVAV